jgi:hypothetical protein
VVISLPSRPVGSGLILLVIVAAWLAVLVPMALRSSETADSVSSVDRFNDAMRVLSRRDAAARARTMQVAGSPRLGEGVDADLDADRDADLALADDLGLADADLADDLLDGEPDLSEWDPARDGLLARARRWSGSAAAVAASGVAAVRTRRAPGGAPLSPAARRRRLLVVLLVLVAATLAGALLAGGAVWALHGVADLLVAGYVVQLRRLVRRRAALAARARSRSRVARPPAARPARPAPSRTAPVAHRPAEQLFDQAAGEPVVEQEPAERVEPVAAVARHDEPVPAVPERSLGLGALWSPVPVPPPLYARAPVAPRLPRTVDLTRPGAYADAVAAGERLPGMEDLPAAPERADQPRRAVNDW